MVRIDVAVVDLTDEDARDVERDVMRVGGALTADPDAGRVEAAIEALGFAVSR